MDFRALRRHKVPREDLLHEVAIGDVSLGELLLERWGWQWL